MRGTVREYPAFRSRKHREFDTYLCKAEWNVAVARPGFYTLVQLALLRKAHEKTLSDARPALSLLHRTV